MQFQRIFEFSPKLKLAIEVVWDAVCLLLAFLFAYWVRIGFDAWSFSSVEWSIVAANIVFTLSLLLFFGHYRQMIRYIEAKAVYIIVLSITLSVLYLYAAKYALGLFLPNAVPVIYWALAFLMLAAPRFLIQTSAQSQSYRIREKCIIFGASDAGRSLAMTLKSGRDLLPVAFVDDKRTYQGMQILGLPVVPRDEIPYLIEKHGVNKMLLAVNNTSTERRKELITELEPYALELLSVPNFRDIVSGKFKIDELKEIKIEELLGRDPVPPIVELLDVDIRGKRVMVTGAGGSIGSELCRQIVKSEPQSIILYELSEFNLYQIENELNTQYPDLVIVPILATIQDADAVRHAVEHNKIQTIYHAAAYKHVPMVEANPLAGLRNNLFGTSNVALVAVEFDIEKFVLISTDKAVRPTNIMGATKRFAELFVQGVAELSSNTKFAIVRFGNVLGSSGSVVPLFTRQIKEGGPITVTHPDIIRYFMTIPEAAQLVIQAGAMGHSGEVFVLDMGEPVKIVDLATKMAHLMGHAIRSSSEGNTSGIELKFTGLRPGEKLYEELLIDESDTQTQHPRIMGANERRLEFHNVVMILDKLNFAMLNNDNVEAKRILLEEAPLDYLPKDQDNEKQAV